MKVAAIGDLHCRTNNAGELHDLLAPIPGEADVLVVSGDLTDNGKPEEARLVAAELKDLAIPVVAVLGNHDHEGGCPEEINMILAEHGVQMLDGSAVEINGVGFVGAKGFCGGFGNTLVQPFGEQALKTFIQAGIEEALRVENAVAKLCCDRKVGVLHYAPIRDTLEGEPLELYPFLGSSRLCSALERRGVDVIVHGHAHHGSPIGKTASNIPVHNVARFVLAKYGPKPYCVFEI